MAENQPPGLREAISDIANRLPSYGRLSASLVQEGWMAAPKQGPLMNVMGVGGFYKLTRWIPLLRQVNQVLITVGAIRYALNEMQPENANRHLQQAGLTREQVEADFQTVTNITRFYAADGTRIASHAASEGMKHAGHYAEEGMKHAGHYAEEGIKHAGRAAGRGYRAFQRWKETWDTDDDEPDPQR